MKVIGLSCPCTPETILPLNHYEEEDCGRVPPRLAQRILQSIEEDKSHCNGNVTVTRLLGCARETIISDFIPVVLDLKGMFSITWGLAMEDWIRQAEGTPGKQRLSCTLFGVVVSGEPDETNGHLSDYKVHGEYTQKKKVEEGASRELAAQLNLYRILEEMQLPKLDKAGNDLSPLPEPKPMFAWHGANLPKNSPTPAWHRQEVPIMTLSQIGEMRPLSGGYTVLEIATALKTAVRLIKEEKADPKVVAAAMPLMGESMKFGKAKKCDYCSVSAKCAELEGKRQL